jgi:hypothetical protein
MSKRPWKPQSVGKPPPESWRSAAWRVLRVDFEAYLERIRKAAERRYRRLRD